MGKIIVKGFILIALFVGIWFGVSQINWVKLFRIDYIRDEMCHEWGNLNWHSFCDENWDDCDSTVVYELDDLMNQISTNIDIDSISINSEIVLLDSEN